MIFAQDYCFLSLARSELHRIQTTWSLHLMYFGLERSPLRLAALM